MRHLDILVVYHINITLGLEDCSFYDPKMSTLFLTPKIQIYSFPHFVRSVAINLPNLPQWEIGVAVVPREWTHIALYYGGLAKYMSYMGVMHEENNFEKIGKISDFWFGCKEIYGCIGEKSV